MNTGVRGAGFVTKMGRAIQALSRATLTALHALSIRIKPQRLTAFSIVLLLPLIAGANVAVISVNSPSIVQPASGSAPLNFQITRTGDTSYAVNVPYSTSNGTAVAGTDYTATSSSVIIPAGASSATAAVPVLAGNNAVNKSFSLTLASPAGLGPIPSFALQETFAKLNDISEVTSATSADVNGDGRPDLLVARRGDTHALSVLLNTTPAGAETPTFANQQNYPLSTNPVSITSADMNGDGRPDVLVANSSFNSVSVLFNTTLPGATTSSFAAMQTVALTVNDGPLDNPTAINTADINGDGRPDLLATISGPGDPGSVESSYVAVMLNTTSPGAATFSFTSQQNFATDTFSVSVTSADVNGDGRLDLLTANNSLR